MLPRGHGGDGAEPDRARRPRPPRRPRASGRSPTTAAPTLTHALQCGQPRHRLERAPCSVADQRGVARPQNGRCDAGAFEFVGEPPPADDDAAGDDLRPGEDGPKQDGFETMAFTIPRHRQPHAAERAQLRVPAARAGPDRAAGARRRPGSPIPPELMWNGCASPWSVPLLEEGLLTFEVRAIDRAGNVDPTPISELISGDGMDAARHDHRRGAGPDPGKPPPADPSTNSRSALFSFTGVSDFTPAAVRGVRVPPGQPRSGAVARVHQPGHVLRPDDRPAHVRGARDRRRDRGPRRSDARPLHLARRARPRRSRRRRRSTATRRTSP